MSYRRAVGEIPPLFLSLLVVSIGYSPMTIADIIKMRVAYINFRFMKYVIIFICLIDIYGAMC